MFIDAVNSSVKNASMTYFNSCREDPETTRRRETTQREHPQSENMISANALVTQQDTFKKVEFIDYRKK